MKVIIALAALIAVVASAPPALTRDQDAAVVKFSNENIGVDGYQFGYETSNGIQQQEQGVLQNAGTDHEAVVARGQFSYVGADGVTYQVTYTADENGFQPQGAHLPQAPTA